MLMSTCIPSLYYYYIQRIKYTKKTDGNKTCFLYSENTDLQDYTVLDNQTS
jgi:hypothetical protein